MKILTLLLILLSGLKTNAQSPHRFHVQFDRDYYVASEDVWFTVHFFNENQIESKVFYVDLIHPNGEVVLSQKLKIEGNSTHGDFRIPPDWDEGIYLFRAYTFWNLNFGSKFIFTRRIPIYGLAETEISNFVNDSEKADFQVFTPGFAEADELADINLESEKVQYQPREKVRLKIEIRDKSGKPVSGNFSVCVKNNEFISRQKLPSELLRQKQKTEKSAAEIRTLTEFPFPVEKDLRLRVHVSNDTMLSSVSYLTPVYLTENRTKISSELGFPPITFLMPDFYGKRTLQFPEFRNFECGKDFIIENTADLLRMKGTGQTTLPHSREIDRYLNRVRQQRKTEQIFEIETLSPLPDYPKIEHAGPADRVYPIDDFATFGDIFHFTEEVIGVPLARIIKKKNGKRGIRLFNQDHNRKLADQPLYLINDYLEFDEDRALSLDWENVERIELFTRDYSMVQHFGTYGINGVFAIYTRDRKTPETLTNAQFNGDFEGFTMPRKFKMPDYGKAKISAERTPDIRATEYWNPTLKTDKKGRAAVEFFASDALGKYWVHVEGVTENGEIFIGEMTYLVR